MQDFAARYRRAVPFILSAYVLLVAAAFVYFNARLSLEWVSIVLFVAALLSGRALLFVRDWGVFLVALFAWQFISQIADDFPFPWHLQELVAADKLMFLGNVPPQWLQQHLYHPGVLEPWDVLASTMYLLHFLVPLLAGFALWLANRDLFRRFALTFVVVAVAGFITYILYPAVPPWLAARPLVETAHHHYVVNWHHGHVYLKGVQNLFAVDMGNWYHPDNGNISLFRQLHVHYDQVGAIPSEHAAYPLLFFLFLRRQFGRIAYLCLVYIAALLFSITYLGQHYVIDAIVGFAYAGLGYAAVMHVAPALMARFGRRREKRVLALPQRSQLEEA